ncbi:MAG: DNA polymerase III subunit delta [Chloroflexi bacterium]|nr:DNA polymerase III subunit delta [Chloroflexota bacterium]
MLYILTGEDDFSLRQSLDEIKKGAGDLELLATNTTTLDGKQVTPGQLRNVCETMPFLAEKRLVVVTGLLERFEPKGRSAKKKSSTRPAGEKNGSEQFSVALGTIPESTLLVLMDGKIGNTNPLFQALSKKAVIKSFQSLKGDDLKKWIQKRVAEEGGSVSPQATDLLAKLVGSDLWIMSNEIDKLISFAGGRRIEEEDVKAMVSYAQETNIFTLVDAILDSKTGFAEQLLQRMLQAGVAPAYLLTMLGRQLRMIVQVKELKSQKKSRTEMLAKIGSNSEFVLRKTSEQADRYPWERLKEVYRKLLDTDLAIKTGRYHEELALDMLIAEIGQRGPL